MSAPGRLNRRDVGCNGVELGCRDSCCVPACLAREGERRRLLGYIYGHDWQTCVVELEKETSGLFGSVFSPFYRIQIYEAILV